MKRYVPIKWTADSELSKAERASVENQRRDLWEHGVRREPLLTEMAFIFAATIEMMRTPKAAR
jgi:hypothetical protein